MIDSESPELTLQVWPSLAGSLVFPTLDKGSAERRAAMVLAGVDPGSAVVVQDAAVCAALVEGGAQLVRHLHTMRHDLREVPDATAVPRLRIRPWQVDDALPLAAAMLGAYGPGHPDARNGDLDAAALNITQTVTDPHNPMMERATQVAEVDGRPVGAALVLRSEHIAGWCGPWLMNMFRAPDRTLPGVGAAILTRALEVLQADGEPYFGLAVTSTNPARRVYERLGFKYGFEAWVVVLPGAVL